MMRFLASICVCGFAFAVLSANPPAAPPTSPPTSAEPTSKVANPVGAQTHKIPKESCVTPCFTAANEALACMKYARENKMEDMAKECEICHHACLACGIAVGSKNARSWDICELCEKVCTDCATSCEKSTNDHAKKCAEAARACAKACAEALK